MNVELPQEMDTPYLDCSPERAYVKNRRRLLQVMLATMMPRVAIADGAGMRERSAPGREGSRRRVCLIANSTQWFFGGTLPGGIVEIGAVEVSGLNLTGRKLHRYINTEYEIDPEMFEHHGLSREILIGAPRFAEVAVEFACFIHGAELVMTEERERNWIDIELSRAAMPPAKALCRRSTYTFDWCREIYGSQSPAIVRAGLRKLHNISETQPIRTALERAQSLALAYIQLHKLELACKHLVTL